MKYWPRDGSGWTSISSSDREDLVVLKFSYGHRVTLSARLKGWKACGPLHQPVLGTDPPGGALGHRFTDIAGFLDQVAVTELRVLVVGVEQGVGAVGLDDLGIGNRVGPPAVVGLTGELEYPARHRHGDPVGGEPVTSG